MVLQTYILFLLPLFSSKTLHSTSHPGCLSWEFTTELYRHWDECWISLLIHTILTSNIDPERSRVMSMVKTNEPISVFEVSQKNSNTWFKNYSSSMFFPKVLWFGYPVSEEKQRKQSQSKFKANQDPIYCANPVLCIKDVSPTTTKKFSRLPERSPKTDQTTFPQYIWEHESTEKASSEQIFLVSSRATPR